MPEPPTSSFRPLPPFMYSFWRFCPGELSSWCWSAMSPSLLRFGARSRRSFIRAHHFAFGHDVTAHRLQGVFFGEPERSERIHVEGVQMEMVVMRAILFRWARSPESCLAEAVHTGPADRGLFE